MADFKDFQDLNQKIKAMIPATAQSTLAGLLDVYNTIVSKLVTVADSYARSYVTVQRLGTDASGNVVDNTTANGEHIANQQIVRYQCDVKSLIERQQQLETLLRQTLEFQLPSTTDMTVFSASNLLHRKNNITQNHVITELEEYTEITYELSDSVSRGAFIISNADGTGIIGKYPNIISQLSVVSSRGRYRIALLTYLTGGGWNKNNSFVNHMLVVVDPDHKVYYSDFTTTKSWWPKVADIPVAKFIIRNGSIDLDSFWLGVTPITLTELTAAQYAAIDALNDSSPRDSIINCAHAALNMPNQGGYISLVNLNVSDGTQYNEIHGNVGYNSFNLDPPNVQQIEDIIQGEIVDVFAILTPGLKPSGLETASQALLDINAD